MTKQEAIRIRSAYCNGFQFPFGAGLVENCDMTEVDRHALLLDEAIKKQISENPVDIPDNSFGDKVLSCPTCKAPIVNVWNKKGYAPQYCHFCGQALDWSDDK